MDEFNFKETENNNERPQIVLSDNQKNKIKETLKKMDENLVQPQHSVGRTFIGAGFACKPEKIIFKDFEVGKSMSITIELTNRSYSFNSYKLLSLDDEIRDFFEIDYKPPGRLPSGISASMTLVFTPMVDKDYFSHLKLLSETGPINIPIECLSKKCIIEIENPIIDFGEIILGEEVTKTLNLSNQGGLSCNYSLTDDKKEIITDEVVVPAPTIHEDDRSKSFKDFTERSIIIDKENFLENGDFLKYFIKQVKFTYKGVISYFNIDYKFLF